MMIFVENSPEAEASEEVQVTQIPVTSIPVSSPSSQPPVPESTQDNSVLDNLVSHCSGELPEVNLNLEKASETASEVVASEKVVSESPQQHTPEPQKTSSPQQQSPNTHIDPQPEQTLPQPTDVIKPTSPNNPPTVTSMDVDTDHLVNSQASTSTIQINPAQSSSSAQPDQHINIPESDPVQDLSLSASDQPSDLEILEQPPQDILESDYIESELLKINSEMQDLVHLRRLIELPIAYEEQWSSLKKRASDLMEAVSRKCIRIKAATVRRFLENLTSAEQAKTPMLLLENVPFYSESEYISRDEKIFKKLRQKLARQQEESKAREDALLQRQLALEELVKKQAEQMEKMMAMIQQQQQPKP